MLELVSAEYLGIIQEEVARMWTKTFLQVGYIGPESNPEAEPLLPLQIIVSGRVTVPKRFGKGWHKAEG